MQRVLLQRQAEVCLQSSEHRIVRTEAVRTLQEVVDPGDQAAAQALGTVVLDEDRFVHRALVDALVVHSADPQARSALHELAQDHDRFVQNAARHAISELGDVQSSELEAKMSRASGPPYVPRPPPGRTVVKTGRRFIGGSFRPQSRPVGLRAPPAQKVPPPRLWIEDANADTDCSETEVRTGRRLSAEYAVTVPEWADVPRAMAVSGDEFVSCHPVPGGVKLVLRRSGNPAREPSPDYTVADVQGTLEELEQEVPEVDEDQFDENQWMNDNRLQCLAEGAEVCPPSEARRRPAAPRRQERGEFSRSAWPDGPRRLPLGTIRSRTAILSETILSETSLAAVVRQASRISYAGNMLPKGLDAKSPGFAMLMQDWVSSYQKTRVRARMACRPLWGE
ncbi:unnamed protein product, partial [Symbiodinium necroappetens]